ncbi:MAG: hypothetical protein KAX65_16560 [Caldilineaceae bacterium]|nr:hypothetical protein [Caldilineaceae bacterium]
MNPINSSASASDRSNSPAEPQFDLFALDQYDDDALWDIAHSELSAGDTTRLIWLLEEHSDNALTSSDRAELEARSAAAQDLLLRKAHAAALLQQRGYAAQAPDGF